MSTHAFPRLARGDLGPDLLRELLDGERVGVVIEDAFPADALARAVSRLEDPAADLTWTPQQHWDATAHQFELLGESLTPYVDHPDGPDPDHYFSAAERFRRDAARLFGPFDLEAALHDVVAPLCGGRPLRNAEDAGRAYTPATIRRLPPRTAIPLHCGDFFMETGGYEHLRTVLDLCGQLSWFVPLQTAESGGLLRVTDLAWQDPAVPRLDDDLFWDPVAIRAQREFTAVDPGVGDMVLFDGGRWFHEVSEVGGARIRWTVGGFLGFTRDRDAVLYWN